MLAVGILAVAILAAAIVAARLTARVVEFESFERFQRHVFAAKLPHSSLDRVMDLDSQGCRP